MNGSGIYGLMFLIVGLVDWSRISAMVRPIQGSGIKILLPIIYISPVLTLFSELPVQLKAWEIVIAALFGVLLSIPLMFTTKYEIRQDGQIYAQKNKSFFIALIAIAAIRIVLRQFFFDIDPTSLSMLFFTVAFSYVVPWRIVSFAKFRKVKMSQTLDDVLPSVKA
ncbi:cytochrome c biogenesis protein CcdC [Neobacillus cucumis]|uniref:cytochrome c biogenesis protein CcdC n=1 Tax=Neobacillus cucumis TaxID=1740721 RepID=UPI001963F126|nr:cytochrome c biogenesis protein CcdC [Neobacillus cucumis]MBM7650915.1 membrane protein CcdC involved in cytochrome C biogenesis [Neobacillus cucumis]